MRFAISNAFGDLAVGVHKRSTLGEALDMAKEMLARGGRNKVSILDGETGKKYDMSEIAELIRLRDKEDAKGT